MPSPADNNAVAARASEAKPTKAGAGDLGRIAIDHAAVLAVKPP